MDLRTGSLVVKTTLPTTVSDNHLFILDCVRISQSSDVRRVVNEEFHMVESNGLNLRT